MDDPSVLQNITSFGLLRGASSLCNKTVRNLIHPRAQEDRTEFNSLSGDPVCENVVSSSDDVSGGVASSRTGTDGGHIKVLG